MNPAGHLDPEEAAAYERHDGTLSVAERLAISDHAAACAVCRALLAGAQAAPPDLARVFAKLIEDGRQEEAPTQESWTGAEEFVSALPAPTAAEREETRTFAARMSDFEQEQFVPGGTLGAAAKTGRREPVAVAVVGGSGWWQRLFSWQGLTLAGAVAAVVLAAVIAVPRSGRQPRAGSVAVVQKTAPRAADLVDGPVQVSADGVLGGLASIPADLRDAVAETVRRGAVPGALLGKLTRGGGTETNTQATAMVDGLAVSTPVSPVSTSVETDQPVFRWKAASPVQIVVRPSAGGEEMRSVPLPTGTVEWTPPTPLPRGALYRWQIVSMTPEGEVVTKGEGARAGVVFKVLSADAHERLEALRTGASGRSHLTLGVAYAREGLKEESAREFHALQEGNAQSVLAKRLVDSLEGRGS